MAAIKQTRRARDRDEEHPSRQVVINMRLDEICLTACQAQPRTDLANGVSRGRTTVQLKFVLHPQSANRARRNPCLGSFRNRHSTRHRQPQRAARPLRTKSPEIALTAPRPIRLVHATSADARKYDPSDDYPYSPQRDHCGSPFRGGVDASRPLRCRAVRIQASQNAPTRRAVHVQRVGNRHHATTHRPIHRTEQAQVI